ncbi:MAG TPA: hypothetical protein VH601_15805 [Bryobacteraceae bacterium]|jgi:hypothetical protein
MNDSALPLSPPAEISPEQPREGRTGPRSPDGKARSSENAITHGCRSEKLILRHEDPAEFEALRDAWFRHYQAPSEIVIALLEETVRAHWFLKRAQKQLDDIVWELPANAYHWTEEHERLFRNFTRYKNSHERTFFRFFRELDAHFHRNMPSLEMKQRALTLAAILQEQSSGNPRKEQSASQPDKSPGAIKSDQESECALVLVERNACPVAGGSRRPCRYEP